MRAVTSSEVCELAAKQAIRDVLSAYCRAMDRCDRDLALATWHSGGTCDYLNSFQGTGTEFVDWVLVRHSRLLRHSHQVTNVDIKVDVENDRAVSEAYVTATLWRPPEGSPTETLSRGRYLDRWSNRDGRWAIDHRVFVQDLMTNTPIPANSLELVAAQSRRDPADPSYELFASIVP